MNKFRIHRSDGGSVDYTGEYRVLSSGVLVVKPDGQAPFLMSPSGWLEVAIMDSPGMGLDEVMGETRGL